MRFTVVTIFPEMFASVLDAGILGRAVAAGLVGVDFVNPRDFTHDRHRTVDDTPYGGGPGMVMKAEPLLAAIEAASAPPGGEQEAAGNGRARAHRILMSPVGAPLSQPRVQALARHEHIVLVCGRYEGIDERVTELAIDEELSIGDFVLSGGELAAMTVIDAVARYVPGVLGEATSTDEESFSDALLEYPQYTRPPSVRDLGIPEVLTSGNHARIADWRRSRALARTARRRPDLLARHRFTERDRRLFAALPEANPAQRTFVALVHHPVVDRNQELVTSTVTNLDIHDIARTAATYGLGGYYVVTPIAAQREMVGRIVGVWRDEIHQVDVDKRTAALSAVHPVASIEEAAADVAHTAGQAPLMVATSARRGSPHAIGFAELGERIRAEASRPVLLLMGTGWGLHPKVIEQVDHVLAPISGIPEFNHLSVRSATAVILDRLFGLREG